MTQAKKLKKKVRARAARTGESYSAARRHVIAARQKRRPPAPARPAASPDLTRGAVSAAKVLERTGRPLDHWFAVLDAFDARAKGHTAAARHLSADHGVDGWYSQGITVAWERLHGLRAVNQRADGRFEVSVSKVVDVPPEAVAAAFNDRNRRRAWLAGQDASIPAAFDASPRPMLVVKDGAAARLRLEHGPSAIVIHVDAKPNGRASVVAQVTKLPTAAAVAERRAAWRSALEALRAHLRAR